MNLLRDLTEWAAFFGGVMTDGEVLGFDRNGEPVRVGDYLAINDYVAEVTRRGLVYVRENGGLLGETDSQPLRVWLRWHTRARARELGFPAPSGGDSMPRDSAEPVRQQPAEEPRPSEGCQDPCYICGQSDPIVARLENEPICEHCYTHCHECSAALIAGRDATVLTERLCDYCDRRAAYVLAGREPRVDLPVPAESYEDGDVYELPNAEWP